MEALPFASFFKALRTNGFSITHGQVINAYKIILKYTDKVRDEELCAYLAPVFASSENEQRLFKEIFDAEFKTGEQLKLRKSFRQRMDVQGKRHPVILIATYALIALLLLWVIIFSYHNYNSINENQVQVYLEHINGNDDDTTKEHVFYEKVDRQVKVGIYCRYKNQLQKNFTLNAQYDWGDNDKAGESAAHIYRSPGEYRLTANVEVLYNKNFIKREIISYQVIVCPDATLSIAVPANNTVIPLGRKILLRSLINDAVPADSIYIQWKEGDLLLGEEENLKISFDVDGYHTISCTAGFDDINSCKLEKTIVISAGNVAGKIDTARKKDITIPIPEKKNTAEPDLFKRDKTFLYGLYFLLAFVFCGLSVFFFILYQKAILVKTGWKSKDTNEHLQLVFSPSQKRLTKALSFPQNNELLHDMPVFGEIAKPLRNRIHDSISFLHVEKTIQQSINAGGMFQMVKAPRTRPPEYLVLIDENARNHNMVKLFEYLLWVFKKQNIVVEKFYFKTDPLHCYNVNEPAGTSLDKLSARYNKHVLLIFGDAQQLVSQNIATLNAAYTDIMRHWQYKAIVTPVSYLDWGFKEAVLSDALPLFPVDIQGLVILSGSLLAEKENAVIISRLKLTANSFYKVAGIDFEDIHQLESYCNAAAWACINQNGVVVNVMFEWIKALAVYPKAQWEIVIAVGKAILDKYRMSHHFNFTSLLQVVRIGWIKQGVFPDAIRLDLLKIIARENEIIARETVLQLLNQIPGDELPQNTTAYSEREMQKLVNEFNLYAHDPVTYYQYRESQDIFESIWTNDLFSDMPMKLYLKNKDGLWQNLLQHDAVNDNTGIEKYFEAVEIEETNLSRTYLWLTVISVFVFVSSFFAILILYRWDAVGM